MARTQTGKDQKGGSSDNKGRWRQGKPSLLAEALAEEQEAEDEDEDEDGVRASKR